MMLSKVTINFAPLIGWPIIIYMAFDIWGKSGIWLAVGVLFCTVTMSLTFRRKL